VGQNSPAGLHRRRLCPSTDISAAAATSERTGWRIMSQSNPTVEILYSLKLTGMAQACPEHVAAGVGKTLRPKPGVPTEPLCRLWPGLGPGVVAGCLTGRCQLHPGDHGRSVDSRRLGTLELLSPGPARHPWSRRAMQYTAPRLSSSACHPPTDGLQRRQSPPFLPGCHPDLPLSWSCSRMRTVVDAWNPAGLGYCNVVILVGDDDEIIAAPARPPALISVKYMTKQCSCFRPDGQAGAFGVIRANMDANLLYSLLLFFLHRSDIGLGKGQVVACGAIPTTSVGCDLKTDLRNESSPA